MFEQTFKNIDDVLWKEAGCATELDYTEQTSWILFLKYLDDLERANETKAHTLAENINDIQDKDRFDLLENCNLHSVLAMQSGTFQGAGVKTVVLFFEKGAASDARREVCASCQ